MRGWAVPSTTGCAGLQPMTEHLLYMQRAVQLAHLAGPAVRTNPMVGAVLVHRGRIVGEGYHQAYGGGHAEVNAIAASPPELLHECTLYVTLEPCTHFGKTPPCVDLVVQKKIPRVVIGQLDPNPQVHSRGRHRLLGAGVEVRVLNDDGSAQLLRPFVVQQCLSRPYITLKWAETADGYLGLPDVRLMLTGIQAQRYTHRLRAASQALLIGHGTYRIDKPRLDTRLYPGPSPIVLLLQRTPTVTQNPFHAPLWVLNAERNDRLAEDLRLLKVDYTAKGAELAILMEQLYYEGIGTLMVEGGSQLLKSLMVNGLWDELHVLRSPHRLARPDGLPAPQPGIELLPQPLPGPDTLWYFQKPLPTYG